MFRNETLRASVLATLAGGATDSNPGNGKVADVRESNKVMLACRFTGAAGIAGNIDFTFALSIDGTNYDTIAFSTKAVATDGANTVQASYQLDVQGAAWIKWASVKNNDATHAISNIQIDIGIPCR